jgi:hypothetical protein
MSAYDQALDRAVSVLAGYMLQKETAASSAEATPNAVRAYVGNAKATAFPREAVETVTRAVLVRFGDAVSGPLHKGLTAKLGAEAADVVDQKVADAIAAGLVGIAKGLPR